MSVASTKLSILRTKLQRYETNHILHAILSFFTGGLWLFMWVLVALSNSLERGRITREMLAIAKSAE